MHYNISIYVPHQVQNDAAVHNNWPASETAEVSRCWAYGLHILRGIELGSFAEHVTNSLYRVSSLIISRLTRNCHWTLCLVTRIQLSTIP
jgi:hypothetical protein